ncbi:MAG: family 20 glycosylhydrolase [Gammaproteobacteria bacterium]
MVASLVVFLLLGVFLLSGCLGSDPSIGDPGIADPRVGNPGISDSGISGPEIKAAHLSMRGKTVATTIRFLNLAHANGMTHVILQLSDGVRLQALQGVARDDALHQFEIAEIVSHADSLGVRIIPELKLLAKQDKFLKDTRLDLMYDALTYNPLSSVYEEVVFPVLDEVIALFDPAIIHIGHDELFFAQYPDHARNSDLPADLFRLDVETLTAYLEARNVEVMMWGDMLLGAWEFAGVETRHMHADGPYAALRRQLPPSIIIADWHYKHTETKFPSARAFMLDGYRVLGATWDSPKNIVNFANYIHDVGGHGHIAGVYGYPGRGDWEGTESILKVSGEAF